MSKLKSKYIADTAKLNTSDKGVDNSNEFFKEAEVDDTNGMLKYAVDVDNDMEKIADKVKSQIPSNTK